MTPDHHLSPTKMSSLLAKQQMHFIILCVPDRIMILLEMVDGRAGRVVGGLLLSLSPCPMFAILFFSPRSPVSSGVRTV